MAKFELFCLIFYALDSVWDASHDEHLGQYLSDANPFLWAEKVSANPAIYDAFCKCIPQENIALEDSYYLAQSYIDTLPDCYMKAVKQAFTHITQDAWLKSAEKYLSHPQY